MQPRHPKVVSEFRDANGSRVAARSFERIRTSEDGFSQRPHHTFFHLRLRELLFTHSASE